MIDIGGWWLICGGGRWLWVVAIDLRCGLLWVVVDDKKKEIIYYFNV